MNKSNLLDQLAQYGYVLMKPKATQSPEKLLEALLKQDDARFLEGFPVVLANALGEKENLEWEHSKWHGAGLSAKSRKKLVVMLALSYYLFRLFGLSEQMEKRALKLVNKLKGNETFANLNEPFTQSKDVKADGVSLSTERLKDTFRKYVLMSNQGEEVEKKKRALELELLLSELFSPRQKELLEKRLEGKPFTKTEREYFYRVVKKRLKALASDELHQMACSLV